MTRTAHRAWRRASICAVVLGLTPLSARAAPPDPDPDPIEEAPSEPTPNEVERAPALVTGIVGLASLTTAVVFTIRSSNYARSLAADLERRVQYDQDDRRLDLGRRDAIIASVMYGVTAAVGALTLYYLLRPKPQKRRRSLDSAWRLSPSFDRHGGSMTLRVEF